MTSEKQRSAAAQVIVDKDAQFGRITKVRELLDEATQCAFTASDTWVVQDLGSFLDATIRELERLVRVGQSNIIAAIHDDLKPQESTNGE